MQAVSLVIVGFLLYRKRNDNKLDATAMLGEPLLQGQDGMELRGMGTAARKTAVEEGKSAISPVLDPALALAPVPVLAPAPTFDPAPILASAPVLAASGNGNGNAMGRNWDTGVIDLNKPSNNSIIEAENGALVLFVCV